MVAVFLSISVVLCSIAVGFGKQHPWLTGDQAKWFLALEMALLALAVSASNLWVGMGLAWIALHPWIALSGFRAKILPICPVQHAVYVPLWRVLWWAVAYLLATTFWRPGDWRILAWTVVAGCLLNLAFIIRWRWSSKAVWWTDLPQTPRNRPCAITGGPFRLAWLMAMGCLSAGVLAVMQPGSRFFTLPLAMLLGWVSWWMKSRTSIVAVAAAWTLWMLRSGVDLRVTGAIGVAVSLACLALVIRPSHPESPEPADAAYSKSSSLQHRVKMWTAAWGFLVETRAIGTGLGTWEAMCVQLPEDKLRNQAWFTLHNDWLQSLIELGPVPALCAVGMLIGLWWTAPTNPDAIFGNLIVTSMALWAVPYFPMNDHPAALLVAIGLGMTH